MLAGAGVPILKALQAAAETLSNRAMRADAMDALVLVREGAPLASALARRSASPACCPMFARLGEQTGQLPQMLQRAANQLGAEVQRRAMQLATILEPLLIVAMGVVVMLIVLAVLLPIIQLNQFATMTAVSLDNKLVVAISSRALFDFEEENAHLRERRRPRPTCSCSSSGSTCAARPGHRLLAGARSCWRSTTRRRSASRW